MKKMKLITIVTFLSFGMIILGIQASSKMLRFDVTTIQGDPTVLQNVEIENTIFFHSDLTFDIAMKQGNVEYKIKNGSYDSAYLYDFQQRTIYTRENPDKENRISSEDYSYSTYGNTKCEVYKYPQTYANVGISPYGLIYSDIDTKLIAYPEEDMLLYYREEDSEVEGCGTEHGFKSEIYPEFGRSEVGYMDKASDDNYYVMPVIRSNMDGIAEVYRFTLNSDKEPVKNQKTDGYIVGGYIEPYVYESIYEFEVERGTTSMLRAYQDNLYIWTYKDNTIVLQKFDLHMNLIKEVKSEANFTSDVVNDPSIYLNDSMMLVNVSGNIYVYDLMSMEAIYDTPLKDIKYESIYIEDMYYHAGNVYVVGRVELTSTYGDIIIYAFNDKERVYKGTIQIYNNPYQIKGEGDEPYYIGGEYPYYTRDYTRFVRDPL